MVGDTEADITAKNHGVKVMAVLCGIRDQAQLELYKPDLIVKSQRGCRFNAPISTLRLGNTASPQAVNQPSRTKVNTVKTAEPSNGCLIFVPRRLPSSPPD